MFKGHTKIELTDVITGKTKTYEHTNLVTNAVAENISYMAKIINYDKINDNFLPLYNSAMGGILLFQEKLEENANNTMLPDNSQNPIIGYASNDAYSGDDNKRGSKNGIESTIMDNGYKFVWDFSTSQANGNISSLALTSDICGAGPYIYNSKIAIESVSMSNAGVSDDALKIVDYNFDTSMALVFDAVTATQLKVRQIHLPINKVGIKSQLLVSELVSENIYDLNTSMNNTNALWVKGDDEYYYGIYANNTKTAYMIRISQNNYAADTSFGGEITLSSANNYIVTNGYKNVAVLNGYMYIRYGKTLCRINLNDMNDIREFIISKGSGRLMLSTLGNNLYSGQYVFLNPDNDEEFEIVDRNKSSSNQYWAINSAAAASADRFLFLSENGIFFSAISSTLYYGTTFNYLATINNLDSPITKTSAQTMKITYTLTEV